MGIFFWYIGKSQSKRAILPKFSKKPLLWIMNEDLPNSFNLKTTEIAVKNFKRKTDEE